MGSTTGDHVPAAGRWTVLAILILLVVNGMPSPAAAAIDWGEPVLVAGPEARSDMGFDSLVTFGATGSIVAYTELDIPEARAHLSRTEDGVTTDIPLGFHGITTHPSLAGRGDSIDVVWLRHGGRGRYVKYRHSGDAGVTWSETQNLTAPGENIGPPEVDRDGRGRVAAVWTNGKRGTVRIRVSIDDGTTFRRAVTIGKGFHPTVALGGGVITIAYLKCCPDLPDDFEGEFGYPLVVRRSTDDGRTWSAQIPLAEWAEFPVAYAVGKTVLVAYGKKQPNAREWVAVRRSLDGGMTWGPGVNLSSKEGKTDHFPIVWGRGGVWHAAYEKCLSPLSPESPFCEEGELYYRSSVDDGLTWSPRELLPAAPVTSWPIGVGATTTGPVVAWFEGRNGTANATIHMAAGTEP